MAACTPKNATKKNQIKMIKHRFKYQSLFDEMIDETNSFFLFRIIKFPRNSFKKTNMTIPNFLIQKNHINKTENYT
jgi:hypothetical protein